MAEMSKIKEAFGSLSNTEERHTTIDNAPVLLEEDEKVCGEIVCRTGLQCIDRDCGGIRDKALTVLTGTSESEVSTAILCIAYMCAFEEGKSVCIISSELAKEEIKERLLYFHTVLLYARGQTGKDASGEVEAALLGSRKQGNIFIHECNVVPEQFRDTMLGVVESHPDIKCIIVDGVDLLVNSTTDNKSRDICTLDQQGKLLAKQAEIGVVFTQFLKNDGMQAVRENRPISLNDLTGGIGGYRYIDYCVCFNRDVTDDRSVKISTLKTRDTPGFNNVKLVFD